MMHIHLYISFSFFYVNETDYVMYQSVPKLPIPPPPPWAKPRAFDFFEKFWSNSRYVGSLDGQMPHRLELQLKSVKSPTLKQITIILLSCSRLKFLMQKLLSWKPAFTEVKDSRMNQCLTCAPTTSLLKYFNTRISPCVTHQELRKGSSKERPQDC